MAYGNWGAFVYRNGERQKNREDNTPYAEDELEAGYWQAFGGDAANGTRVATGKELHCCHAVLGSGPVRLCGYKNYPMLYLNGEAVDLELFKKSEGDYTPDYGGEIEGYKFSAVQMGEPSGVELELTEPNGTQWKSKCGYCIGAGHED